MIGPFDHESARYDRVMELRNLMRALPHPAEIARDYYDYDAELRAAIDASTDTAHAILDDLDRGCPMRPPRADCYDHHPEDW